MAATEEPVIAVEPEAEQRAVAVNFTPPLQPLHAFSPSHRCQRRQPLLPFNFHYRPALSLFAARSAQAAITAAVARLHTAPPLPLFAFSLSAAVVFASPPQNQPLLSHNTFLSSSSFISDHQFDVEYCLG